MDLLTRRLIVALLLSGVVSGCNKGEPLTRHLVVVGSRTMTPLVQDIADRFEARNTHVRIDLEPASPDRAVSDTRQGLADIGLVARGLKPDETNLNNLVLARDGIAFVVNRANTVPKLAEIHLVGLLTGVYTTWKDIGGPDKPVVLVGQGEGRAIRDVLVEQLLLKPAQLRPDPSVGTGGQVIQAVAAQPAALGYVSLGLAEAAAASQPIRLLPFAGEAATLENVREGQYKLVRPLVLVTRGKPAGLVKEFLDFACSEEVRDLIDKHGFAPPCP